MKITGRSLLIWMCGAALCSSYAAPKAAPTPTQEYARAADGTPLHWLPYIIQDGKRHPAVILLPGGQFRALYNIPSQVAKDLNNAGYNVFSNVQYRIAPPNKLDGQTSSGQFPQQTDDVALAAAAAKSEDHCDGQVFAVGGSAGGSHAQFLASKRLVKAAVALSPATQYDDAVSRQDNEFRGAVDNYAPGNLAPASPNNMMASDAVPVFIAAFQIDSQPPPQFNLAVSKCTSIGLAYESRLLAGSGHSWDCWPYVSAQAIDFLNSHRGEPSPTPTPNPTPPNPTPVPTPTCCCTCSPRK